MARKDEERWEALRQAAFDYVKAYNTWSMADYIDDAIAADGNAALAHAEAVLKTEAERFRRRPEMRKAGA